VSRCGKIAYPTAQAAWRSAGHILARQKTATKRRSRQVNAYLCEVCEGRVWHTTSRPQQPKGKRR
jgi:hypothetical protein